MRKASLLLSLLLAAFTSSMAQESVTLTFTANTQNGLYCPYDAVNVTNVTRGWTETLAYPDTVLVMNPMGGISEQNEMACRLGEAYPNPFTDETQMSLEMSEAGDVLIQVVRVDGTIVATHKGRLEVGLHSVKVRLSSPSIALLAVHTAQGRQVVRMISAGNGGCDAISIETLSAGFKPDNQSMRSDATGEFQPGDMMRYTTVLFDAANTIYSNTITQQQYESQDMTLYFDLTLPEVATNQVTGITPNTATGGGEVIATGGVSVTERGICWSTSHNPTTSDNHANNGTGTGTYLVQMSDLFADTTYFVRAYAINRIGIAYGDEVSFNTQPCPVGAINGLFTINSNADQVYFSQGNLQYIGSTGIWKFADHQWDVKGTSQGNNNLGTTRDLFGWGTSGYNHGANFCQPWSTSQYNSDYYAYGSWSFNLYDQTGQADWGYNAISNGGNQTNLWRTLTYEEWNYVLNLRNTNSGVLYAKAKVNDVNGVILLPDDWSTGYYSLTNTNLYDAHFSSNVISVSQWMTLEQHGAVFLPAAGSRNGTSVYEVGLEGFYWSSSCDDSDSVWLMGFHDSYVGTGNLDRHDGFSVRLVIEYNPRKNK